MIARAIRGGRNAFSVIAGALEREGLLGGRVRLYFTEEDPRPLARGLRGKGYDVVVMYSVSSPLFLELAGEIEEVASEFKVVAGGPHAAGAYWQLLRLGVYAVVAGDGEPAIVGLVDHLLGGRDLDRVPNIAFVEGDRFAVAGFEYADLDSYPPHSRAASIYPPIEIMRGCSYRCLFCQVPWLFKGRVRFRSPSVVLEAVKDYVSSGRRRIRFVAPIGFAYMSREPGKPNVAAIEELLSGVRRLGGEPYLGSFPSETRPEYVTDEVLSVVARLAANRRVSVGLQSGSDRLLRLVQRDHDVESVYEAVELIKKHGLTPVVDIIFGLPGETDEDVELTVKAMMKLAEDGATLRLHSFMPLPGSPLARAKPRPIHPLYRRATLKLLGKGVVEGDWEAQETLAFDIYCLTAADPAPTPKPAPIPSAASVCRERWKAWKRKPGLGSLLSGLEELEE
ncbi:TIGR04013 family B12-binding domain/radical SAM domain-containing protein [Stetteria hydrogenophila]